LHHGDNLTFNEFGLDQTATIMAQGVHEFTKKSGNSRSRIEWEKGFSEKYILRSRISGKI